MKVTSATFRYFESPQKQQRSEENWGNDWLTSMHEAVLPEPVSWMPQTLGWLALSIIIAILLLFSFWRIWRRWQANSYRRQACAQLREIQQQLSVTNVSAADIERLRIVPELVRRCALHTWPRDRVAGLMGQDWLEFLNAATDRPLLSPVSGYLLNRLAYCSEQELQTLSGECCSNFIKELQLWISQHKRSSS